VAIGERRVFLLQPAGVGQDDLAQILRAQRAEHAAAETLRHEARQIPAMIEVRVRQDNRVDGRCLDRQVLPVPQAQLLQALKKPGVHHDPRAIGFDQVLRPGDRSRRTEKRE